MVPLSRSGLSCASRPLPGRARGELLIADALLTYLALGPAHELTFQYRLLELDRATVPTDTLATKLARYADLYRHIPTSRGEPSRAPAWQARYPIFPDIICVLAGQPRPILKRRAQTVLALCREDPGSRTRPRSECPSRCLTTSKPAHSLRYGTGPTTRPKHLIGSGVLNDAHDTAWGCP